MDHENFPALATLLWAGLVTSIRKLSVGRARRAPVLPVSVEQGCTVLPSITQLHQPLALNSGNSQAQTTPLCPQPSLGSSVS